MAGSWLVAGSLHPPRLIPLRVRHRRTYCVDLKTVPAAPVGEPALSTGR